MAASLCKVGEVFVGKKKKNFFMLNKYKYIWLASFCLWTPRSHTSLAWLFSFRSAIFPSDNNSGEVLKARRELMVKSHVVDFFFLFFLS